MPSILHWASRQKAQAPVQNDLCEQCGQKPKFIEPGGTRHQYCSRSCAKKAQGPNPSACALRGCRATGKPAFSNFCSEEHGRQAVKLGQVQASATFCIACDHKFPGPRLKELAVGGTEFKDVRTQFLSEWDCPSGGRPKVEKVYQIVVPRDVRARHDVFRASQHATEEIRAPKQAVLCEFKSCGICCIVKSCFHEFAFGEKFNIGRFGDGIYSYRNPSLADVHATSATSTPYRVMIACDATVRMWILIVKQVPDEESLFLPIADAIVPAYIIMYTV
ncbi:hypothetical protein FB45DRAFT_993050 [Roridomyces roridus]|uniref:Uncharacterized protein n=1 Tax=Roridomyces roridus TaxID=1738132 RepID=A0AAD7B995_9AGAR|nr:hypothetical protein FB45DRAFT_993050 [Roridomyces roridus]